MDAVMVAGRSVLPNSRMHFELPFARLPWGGDLPLPVHVVHGVEPGPRLWLSAAIHGDEVCGVEVIRRVMERIDPSQFRGTVVAVPIVNMYGFLNQSRYLPDRRDLNRNFPGSAKGSLAAQLAHAFMQEIVAPSQFGVDLHTGSDHRTNLPHIRADLRDQATREVAEAFAAPLLLHARLRDGSLREAAANMGVPCLLYEAGEANRLDSRAIEVGVSGVLAVLAHLHMIDNGTSPNVNGCVTAFASRWVRARSAGICSPSVAPGDRVVRRQKMAVLRDAGGRQLSTLTAPCDGVVVGLARNPVVHRGDGIIHIAEVEAA